MSQERRAYTEIIPPLISIFCDKRNYITTLIIACKCLCLLVSKKIDEVFRKKVIFEGNIISVITNYLKLYDYDEKFILCCLDLFSCLMNDPELNIVEHLYNHGLFDRLKGFFEPTGVPGAYYSQRVSNIIYPVNLVRLLLKYSQSS